MSVSPAAHSSELRPVRVWDLPTRLFHWLLVLAVVAAVVTAKVGGNAIEWHFLLGYAIGALLLFRLIWGVVGGRWSRFTNFVPTPGRLLRYLRGQPQPGEHLEVGHNPLGALSVLALLGWLLVQVGSGLVADDEIANTGPLVRFVSGELSALATSWHTALGQWGLLALVGLHVAAIVFYRLMKGRDLIGPMLKGDQLLPPDVPASADGAGRRLLAAGLLLLCALAVWQLVQLGLAV